MDANPPSGSRRALLLVAIVFLLGIALGAVGTYLSAGRWWTPPRVGQNPRVRRVRLVEQLTRELRLTADQQQKLDGILAEMQAKFKALHEQMAPQSDQLRQQGRAQIRAILTPEQLPKFEDFLRRMDEERKRSD